MVVDAVILVAGLFWVQPSIHPIKTTLKAVFMVMDIELFMSPYFGFLSLVHSLSHMHSLIPL